MKSKIITYEVLTELADKLRNQGKKVVSTSGCFDILHAGHVDYLEKAKSRGDVLILLLNSDVSVRDLKGQERPIVPQDERAFVVAGLACVDYVCIFTESTPCKALSLFRPDVFVKGGEYERMHIPEEDVVSSYGGQVKYVSMVKGCSSTGIIEKIKGMG